MAASFIVKEVVASDARDIEVDAAVVVVVARGRAHAIHGHVEARAGRDIGESPVAAVMVESPGGGRLRGSAGQAGGAAFRVRPGPPIHEEEIGVTVGVEVEEGGARAV